VDQSIADQLPQLPIISELDTIPSIEEISAAANNLKINKAPGPDGIPAEIFKYRGSLLLWRLHSFISNAWASNILPTQWKDANIIMIYKKKGDRAICGNSRGISLLFVTGKLLACVMLICLLTYVVDTVVPESQCGFYRVWSTTDMICVARLLQEKCREQHRDLFIAFIDLTKAFDNVSRDLLWQALGKFGCPPHFLSILREFHTDMSARVVQRELSKSFRVNARVKQGCVLAPVIFNLFLVATTLVFRHISAADGVCIKYRLDGSLFNIRRLQAVMKVTNNTIFDLQYADDAALPSHTPDGLQSQLDAISSAYSRTGLVVNSKKTEVLYLPHLSLPQTFYISGGQLGLTEQFTYLGSVITSTCDLTAEIQHRVNLASAFFGRLSKRVFMNCDLSTRIKMAVYNAVCVSTLLHACEGWTPYCCHIRALEAFHIRCLQTILHVRWWDKIPHVEIRRRADTTCLETILLRRQLRWLGHVIRMPGNRLPCRLFYSELFCGRSSVGVKRSVLRITLSRPYVNAGSLLTDLRTWPGIEKNGVQFATGGWQPLNSNILMWQ